MKRTTIILTILLAPTILLAQDTVDDQYMNAYVVIADTKNDKRIFHRRQKDSAFVSDYEYAYGREVLYLKK